jgi:hypothetical protein
MISQVIPMKCRFPNDDVCSCSPYRCPTPENGNTGRNGCCEIFHSKKPGRFFDLSSTER